MKFFYVCCKCGVVQIHDTDEWPKNYNVEVKCSQCPAPHPDEYLAQRVPTEIRDAARKVSDWFKENGFKKWEFMDIKSR